MVSVTTLSSTNIVDHHGSHQDLLKSPPAGASFARRGVDAIFVPTFRPPAYLAEAANLAQALDCALVTLHSGPYTTALKAASRLPSGVNLIAVDVPGFRRLNLPHWETSRLLRGTVFARRTDLSAKRNLGLSLSRLLGWTRILSLDDDITGLDPEDVRNASGLLDVYNAVGLQIYGFPDHSVVCHAYLQAGGDQRSFIGGGAMLIEVERSNSFFPDIYNDDWFFLLDESGKLQPTTVVGSVIQHRYDPFRTPDRARAEELGDALAEGIYWLLDQGWTIADADEAYWIESLGRRQRFIKGVLAMVEADDTIEGNDKNRRIAALKGSLGRLALISPALCESYLLAWAADRQQWQKHVDQLSAGQDLVKALNLLSREGSRQLSWQSSGKMCRSSRPDGKVYPARLEVQEGPAMPAEIALVPDAIALAAPGAMMAAETEVAAGATSGADSVMS
jgi:hypothetical protein